MSIQNLSALTVVELRKLAKEHKIKLGTNLSKDLIIEKISAGLHEEETEAVIQTQAQSSLADAAQAPVEKQAAEPDLYEAPEEEDAAEEDVPAAPPSREPQKPLSWSSANYSYSTKPAYQAPAYQPKPSWQARQGVPRPSLPRTDTRPAVQPRPQGYAPRFGPGAIQQPKSEPIVPIVPAAAPRQELEPRAPYRAAELAPPVAVLPERPDPAYNDYAQRDRRPRRDAGYYNAEFGTANPAVPEMLQAGECGDGAGLLEIHPDGYGFLRPENFLPGHQDIYVSMAQIRRFGLRTGDYVTGKTRPQREGDKYSALLYITDVNGQSPDELQGRPFFEQLTAIYPTRRIELSAGEAHAPPTLRMMDLVVPIGFGQRGLIIAPPMAGKRRILIELANAITEKYQNAHVMMLLIDVRPEDVTEVRDHVKCEVLSSTFDRSPENHARVAEMVTERAQRLCEKQKDVVVLVDSLTMLARAYNNIAAQQGRAAPGMLNPATLYKAKKLFGTARNLREGGSLTVIGSLSADTGNRLDDAIAEEFKGTATMELYLTRELAEQGVFPAFDLMRSGTRRDELLISKEQQNEIKSVRSVLSASSNTEAVRQLIEMMDKTANNADLLSRLKDWIVLFKRGGFNLSR